MKKALLFFTAILIVASFQNCGVEFEVIKSKDLGSNGGHPIAPPPIQKTIIQQRVGNRFYVANFFKHLFLPKEANFRDCNPLTGRDKTICNKIRNSILKKYSIFGGKCGFQEHSSIICSNATTTVRDIAKVNIAREAGRVNLCSEILQYDQAIESFLGKINMTPLDEANDSNMTLAFKKFYPGEKPKKDMVDSLQTLADSTNNQTDKWRLVILALCESPGWQMY